MTDYEQALSELRQRAVKAAETLLASVNTYREPENRIRVHGKAEGVNLVLSYIDEALRDSAMGKQAALQLCTHCRWPQTGHGQRGACLRAGYYGNHYEASGAASGAAVAVSDQPANPAAGLIAGPPTFDPTHRIEEIAIVPLRLDTTGRWAVDPAELDGFPLSGRDDPHGNMDDNDACWERYTPVEPVLDRHAELMELARELDLPTAHELLELLARALGKSVV